MHSCLLLIVQLNVQVAQLCCYKHWQVHHKSVCLPYVCATHKSPCARLTLTVTYEPGYLLPKTGYITWGSFVPFGSHVNIVEKDRFMFSLWPSRRTLLAYPLVAAHDTPHSALCGRKPEACATRRPHGSLLTQRAKPSSHGTCSW